MTTEELSQLEEVLKWPRETRSLDEYRLVERRRIEVFREMRQIVQKAEALDRDLTPDERESYDALGAEYDALGD